jgi:uncharacterized repeat protein (TIGR02543 family)
MSIKWYDSSTITWQYYSYDDTTRTGDAVRNNKDSFIIYYFNEAKNLIKQIQYKYNSTYKIVEFLEVGIWQYATDYLVSENSNVVLELTPNKTGYTGVWNDDQNLIGYDYNSGSTYELTINKFFYVKYYINSYSLTYDYKGIGTTSNSTTSINYNTTVTLPTTITAYGYTFAGWNTSPTAINGDPITTQIQMPAQNITYYAIWAANLYALTWNPNGGSIGTNGAGISITTTANFKTLVTLPTKPIKQNYKFLGWSNGSTIYTLNFILEVLSTNFTAQWTNIFDITFNYNDSTIENIIYSKTYNDPVQLPDGKPRTGHTFVGWYLFLLPEVIKTAKSYIQMPGYDITYYASWTLNTYTATWIYNNGTSSTTTSIVYKRNLTIPTTPIKTGYTFMGWYDNISMPYITSNFSYIYGNNQSFIAQWSANSYTLTWDTNNPIIANKSISVTAESIIVTPILKAVGYTFSGWFNNKSGEILIALGGNNYTMATSNITLYGKWFANGNIKFTDLQNTYGGTNPISTNEYQSYILQANNTKVSLKANFIGTGPAIS